MNLQFHHQVVAWFDQNRRELPWRDTNDPYAIWVSEIILQQTRVAQGLGYYLRFMQRFPNVRSLAEAPEQEVLRLWQGLGYYSRARNMQKAAQQIMERHEGVFPADYSSIQSLQGIGDYTAAAIASFAFGQPYATVDGNVFRVLSRYWGISTPIDTPQGKKEFTAIANGLLNTDDAGRHNQAMMEFGALQCTPRKPDCENCPLRPDCSAYRNGTIELLPIKKGNTKVQTRYLYYLHLHCNGETLLRKRVERGIWHNLFDYPCIESDSIQTPERVFNTEPIHSLLTGTTIHIGRTIENVKHQLSHRTLFATFFDIEIKNKIPAPAHHQWVKDEELNNYPISRLIEIYNNAPSSLSTQTPEGLK